MTRSELLRASYKQTPMEESAPYKAPKPATKYKHYFSFSFSVDSALEGKTDQEAELITLEAKEALRQIIVTEIQDRSLDWFDTETYD